MKMVLDGYEFPRNPNSSPVIGPVRYTASVPTYAGAAFFSWGLMTAGQTISLTWNYCETDQFDAILDIYAKDEAVLFDPKLGDNKIYMVQITRFEGELFMRLGKYWRQSVTLEMVVMDEGVEVTP